MPTPLRRRLGEVLRYVVRGRGNVRGVWPQDYSGQFPSTSTHCSAPAAPRPSPINESRVHFIGEINVRGAGPDPALLALREAPCSRARSLVRGRAGQVSAGRLMTLRMPSRIRAGGQSAIRSRWPLTLISWHCDRKTAWP